MTDDKPKRKYRVLFLCTGNSARSVLAEYFLRRLDPVRFEAFSAGAKPKGAVNPRVLALLRDGYHIDASGARSKSWDEFRGREDFDFVITVCDGARESCPVWPGQPIVAHWGSDDPDHFQGTEEEKNRALKRVAGEIQRRVQLLTALPIESLDRLRLQELARGIGNS